MNRELHKKMKKIKEEHRIKKKWLRITLSLCVLVAGVTSYVLINPANTVTAETYCGYEEHEHDETCYGLKLVRRISPSEYIKGTPSDYDCNTPSEVYVETPSDAEAAYEADPHHLICGLPVHEHTLQCYSDPEADTETEAVWERMFDTLELTGRFNEDVLSVAETQLGYPESKRNYEVQEDGETMRGYTRYGAWYGDMYGKWDAMFCAFCLHYAGVPEELMPFDPSCGEWTELLKLPEYDLYREADAYTPEPGDIVFFDSDTFDPAYKENREADHVGFVRELIYDEETEALTGIRTIEGIPGDCVSGDNTYDITDSTILGYARLPKNPALLKTIESAPAADGAVAVITGELPDGAEAHIEAVALSDEQLEAYFGKAQAAWMKGYAAYDIKITVDGEEWEPDDTVSVTVRQNTLIAEEDQSFGVAHVDGDTEEVSELNGAIADDGEITFHTDGFSLYIFYTFTVDFHFGDLTFSIAGMDSILLSELFRALGIDLDIAEVSDVSFSDPTLLKIEQTADGDWLLTSLAPFTTNETLTVTFKDGKVLVINVTDAGGNNGATDFSQYLRTTGPNDWQIVDRGYSGNAQSKKILVSNGGGAANLYIQKNVVPTDNENEFYVYLSIDTLATLEDIFNDSQVKINNNQKWKTIGGFTDDLTLNGQVTGLYEHGDLSGGNEYLVYISVYQNHSSTTPLYSYYDVRTGTAPNCSNGTAFIRLPGMNRYLIAQTPISLGGPNGDTIELSIYLNDINIASILTEPVFTSVIDEVGEYITDVEVSNDWCDGTVEYDEDAHKVIWLPEPNQNVVPTLTINPITGWKENVAQLVYKVRLATEQTGFNSCASKMNSTVTDPESYRVNKSAIATYYTNPIPGAVGVTRSEDLTAVFPVPYVRGLLYDLWFEKVADDPEHTPLPGAQFELILADGSVLKDAAGNTRVFISDENGLVGLFGLPQGKYTGIVGVREILPPPFYLLPENNPWDIPLNYTANKTEFTPDDLHDSPQNMRYTSLSGSSTTDWELVNRRVPGKPVVFKKIDSTNGNPVADAVFALYPADESGQIAENPFLGMDNLRSGYNGVFSPDNFQLGYGTFYLKEVSARAGYKLLTEPVKIVVTESGGVTVTGGAESGSPAVTESGEIYTITVENERLSPDEPLPPPDPTYADDPEIDVTLKKQIDYLGDNEGVTGMEDLYRLYLTLDTEVEPTDLLLVIDQSGSMTYDMAGHPKTVKGEVNPDWVENDTRQGNVLKFLNGTETDNSDGFINTFLSANPGNDLAILTFGSDSGSASRYVREWGKSKDIKAVTLPEPSGATNYAAAYFAANEVLNDKPDTDGRRKLMIFLSDGVPTIAYSDGKMHNTLKETDDLKVVGSGSSSPYGMQNYVFRYLTYAFNETYSVSSMTRAGFWQSIITPDKAGDTADMYASQRWVSGTDDSFPVVYDFSTAVMDIPFINNYPLGPFVDADGNEESSGASYGNWHRNERPTGEEAIKAWVNEHTVYKGDKYNIFYLTENAFSDFREANESVPVYSLFFGAYEDISGGSSSEAVLKYMSGNDRYCHCETGESLKKAVYDIAGIRNVICSDTLSSYTDFVAEEASGLEIILKNAAYSDSYESGKDFAYLFKDGAFTTLGNKLLVTGDTGIDPVNKTVNVVFKEDFYYSGAFTCEASFDVRVNDYAYSNYLENGYIGDVGDKDTDREGNSTSAYREGFHSNTKAEAEWYYLGDGKDSYPHPVVQVHLADVQLKKVDSEKPETVLSGAEFDLYRETDSQNYTKTYTVTDGTGTEQLHYLLKVNSTALQSGSDGLIEVKDLRMGQYYLFETKAPDGYNILEEPIVFKVHQSAGSGGAVTHAIELTPGTQPAFVDGDDALLLNIKNRSGYELPYTGGIGDSLFRLLGTILIAGGAVLLFLRKHNMITASEV